MTTFAVTNSNDLLPAVNYLLSNLDTGTAGNVVLPGNVLVANTSTGVVSQSGNAVPFAYLYQYVNLRYSNNATGTDGFDTNSNNYSFFGVYNSTGCWSQYRSKCRQLLARMWNHLYQQSASQCQLWNKPEHFN